METTARWVTEYHEDECEEAERRAKGRRGDVQEVHVCLANEATQALRQHIILKFEKLSIAGCYRQSRKLESLIL
jgi:phage-related baseplate assembly protein